MRRGIRWVVEWFDDRASRERVERKGKQSADEVGAKWKRESTTMAANARAKLGAAFTTVAQGAKAKIASIRAFAQSQFMMIAGYVAAAFGVAAVLNFGRTSTKVYMEAEEIWRTLAAQLQRVGVDFGDVETEISATARAMQDVSRVGDEDFAVVLTELVAISGDYEESLRRVQLVADLAAAKKIDLATSAQLVGRAMIGETGTLSRYGIVADSAEEAMALMEQRFGGMAEASVGLGGKIEMMKNEWGDWQQAVGSALIVGGDGAGVIDSLTQSFKNSAEWTERHRFQVGAWAKVVFETLRMTGRTLSNIVRFLFNTGQVIGDALRTVFSRVTGHIIRLTNAVGERINGLIEAANNLPFIDIDFRFNQADPQVFFDDAAAAQQRLFDNAGDLRDTLLNQADAWGDLGDAIRNANDATETNVSLAREAGVGGTGAGGAGGEGGPGGLPEPTVELAQSLVPPVAVDEAAEEVKTFADFMRDSMAGAAGDVSSAFEDLFTGLALGFDGTETRALSLADAATGVGASMVQSMTEGMAQWQVAEGMADLAAAGWPPNPAALTAAGLHFAAAGAFRALGGIAAGGGGGGAAINAAALGRGAMPGGDIYNRSEAQTPTTIIYLDPLNPYEPAFQDVTYSANKLATERHGQGSNVRPTRHAPPQVRR